MNYAYHTWDYMGATQSWAWHGPFVPQPSDILFGKTQLDMWYDLAATGKISDKYGWKPINFAANFPTNYIVGVELEPDQVSSLENYYHSICTALAAPPLNFNINFWYINK